MQAGEALQLTAATITTVLRGGLGGRVGTPGARPGRVLELYDFEGCPFCRRVREALSVLDLEVDMRPCPRGGRRFREELRRRGGRIQVPYLVDPEAGRALYESSEIVRHLFARYGVEAPPWALGAGPLRTFALASAGLGRGPAGSFVRPSRAPERPLVLYGLEASPACRLVREQLCALELPYRLHHVARGGPARTRFGERFPGARPPVLVDPNVDRTLAGASAIRAHLRRTYAVD